MKFKLYRDEYFCLIEACRRFSDFMKDSRATLRPWVQAFPYGVDRFNKDYIIEQLRALNASETRGWLLWRAGNAYGVARNRLRNAIKRLRVPGRLVNDLGEAEALVTTRANYRKRMKAVEDAEVRGLPIYVLRSNTVPQMENFLSDLFDLQIASGDPQLEDAMHEAHDAIQAVLNGTRSVDLKPASSYIRRLQHQTARQSNLTSHSYGKEPRRRVRIFRD